MELYQLEHFIAVVEEHSFTRAAERVFRTQGAVSVTIRKLEEEVGVPLMVRDSHECALTEAGQALLAYARHIIDLRDEMQRCMGEFRSLTAGRATIAAHESAAQYLLPAPLAAFYTEHPNIKIETRLCDGQEIAHLVAEREVDLGFGLRQTNLHGLSSEAVHEDGLLLVAAPGHRISRRRIVGIAELCDERFFVHSRYTTMRATVERLFADRRVPFNIAAELWNFETIKQFVRTGGGIAIVPASVARPDVEAGRLVAIRVDDLDVTRTIEVVYREKGRLLPAPAALLEFLRRWHWDREGHRAAGWWGGFADPPLPDDAPRGTVEQPTVRMDEQPCVTPEHERHSSDD
jgi:DNA-binding transcriptional LysR family regulator